MTCSCGAEWDFQSILPEYNREAFRLLVEYHVCGEELNLFGASQRTPLVRLLEQQEGPRKLP